MIWTCTDACDGRIRQILFLRTLVTLAPLCARRRCPRARRISGCHCMGRVAHCGARHVRVHGRAGQSAVHRVRLPPPRFGFCLDPAWGMAGCALSREQSSGGFEPESESTPHRRDRVAGVANSSNASNRTGRSHLRCSPASKAYDMKINMETHGRYTTILRLQLLLTSVLYGLSRSHHSGAHNLVLIRK